MADRLAENGAIQYALANPEDGSKRSALSGYIMAALNDWLKNPFPPLSRLAAPGRLRGQFFDSGVAPLAMDFANGQYASGSAGNMSMKSFDDIVNFSRTSNATVTRSDGTIGYAPHNLLTFSEQFDNSFWVKDNTTVTANTTTAPNETSTADTVIENTANGLHRVYSANVTGLIPNTYTFSCYVKANGRTWVALQIGGSTYFNLTGEGSVGSSTAGSSGTITHIGDGWYRCTTTRTLTGTVVGAEVYLATGNSTAVYTGNGTSGVYIWGAQLEVGASPTTYNPTTVKNLLGFSEAFENAAWTKSNSFVQTNLLTFSEAFDNAAWSKLNSTISANDTIAPNSYQTADTYNEGTANNAHGLKSSFVPVANTTYTFSVYAKYVNRQYISLSVSAASTGLAYASAIFDIQNGVVGTTGAVGTGYAVVSSSITSVGNGWYRCIATLTQGSLGASYQAYIGTSDDGSIGNFGLDSYQGTSATVLFWGAQLVQGSVAGDYRRTDAATLPVFYPNHNGVVCAEKLVENTANNVHEINFANISSLTGLSLPVTISVYAKAGERNFARLALNDQLTGTSYAIFNLTTGASSTTSAGSWANLSASSENVGNGWWRLRFTATKGTANCVSFIGAASAINTFFYTGDGTSGIYIFGAQLSDSASLDPYVLNAGAAPASAAYYGPRFDYDPVTLEAKGLLIEEQRSNLLLRSEDFTTSWTLNSATITANTVISPDGTQNADKIVEAATISYHGAFQSVTTSGVLTFSAYFKAAERNYAMLFFDSVGAGRAIFDLVNGTVDSILTGTRVSSANISPVGNGWYRCSITSVSLASSSYFPAVCASNGTASYLGDITKGVYVWGAQLEVGAFPTSYIPTAASAVTRTADVAEIRGSNFYSWYNQNEGTLYADSNTFSSSIATIVASANDNTSNNRIQIGRTNTSNRALRVFVTSNGIEEVSNLGAGTTSVSQFGKVIFGYKVNDFRGAALGTLSAADTLGITPIVNRLEIGFVFSQGSSFNGHIKQINYYNLRLSDSTLQGLTA
jgi:hypothetical protein